MPTIAISARMRVRTVPPVRVSARDDERENEAEQRERLGERDSEEHRGAHRARRLGLARHRGDGVADHEADADAGADGSGAVDDASTDRGEPLGGVGRCGGEEEMQHYHVMLLVVFGQCAGCMEMSMYTAVRMAKMKAWRKLTNTSKPVIATSNANDSGAMITVIFAAHSAAVSTANVVRIR